MVDGSTNATPHGKESGHNAVFSHLTTREFWRNQAVYFCVFSMVGHWMEIVYCLIMDACFGIVDPESLVWDDALYPFPVYGVAVVVCAVIFAPLRDYLVSRQANRQSSRQLRAPASGTRVACGQFYLIAVVASMTMELTQGFIQNQPDENGVYPLWDNSQMPLNILGQAWLVNDILLGFALTLYVWLVLPALDAAVARLPRTVANAGAGVIVCAFIVLCVVKFG